MGDVGDVWNIAKDVATLFANGQHVAMASRGCAVPNGMQPGQLDWAGSQEQTLQFSESWTNRAKEWFGASSGTIIRMGVTFQYGGHAPNMSGNYLHDAYLWAVADAVMLGDNITITGQFGDAVPHGNTAELSGLIWLNRTQFGIQEDQLQYDVRIYGNGAGRIRYV
jgi:hypothetical protein